jgi:hypothetical protein
MSCKDNYLLVAMHAASDYLLKKFWEKRPGGKKFEEIEAQGYDVYEHNNEYTIIFTEIDEGDKEGSKAKIKEIVDKESLNKKNTFALLHGDDRPFSTIPNIGIPASQIELFSGASSIPGYFAYSILNALMKFPKKPKKFHSWIEIKRFFQLKWPEFLVQNLTPLFLALQAFFGLRKDENNDWKCIPDDLPGEVKKILGSTLSKENRRKSFLLVQEAEYDFFAEIGSRLGSEKESKEILGKPIEDWPIVNLLKELSRDETILKYENFSDIDETNINGKTLQKELKDIISNSEELKTVCAILANIEGDGINPLIHKKPGQPPEEIKKPNELRNRISASRSNLAELPACKKWFEESPPTHTKWPTEGDQPQGSYWDLVEQLEEWNRDGTRAREAIKQIETMAHYLAQIGEYMREKTHP